jgi:XTP/dITP diphosphohydrolase
LAELQALLATLAPELLTRVTLTSLGELGISEEVVEDGSTFAANAIIKAKAACERTGLWALSDDSGLQVEALGGAPGIHSARWAGEPRSDERNLAKLLTELARSHRTSARPASPVRSVCTGSRRGRRSRR